MPAYLNEVKSKPECPVGLRPWNELTECLSWHRETNSYFSVLSVYSKTRDNKQLDGVVKILGNPVAPKNITISN